MIFERTSKALTLPPMLKWELIRWVHILALSFFVGGQLMLLLVVVPIVRDREALKMAARRFAVGSAIAGIVLIATGSLLASHFHLWSNPTLHIKLTLVAAATALIVVHMRKPTWHILEGVVLLISLVIVLLGVQTSH